MNGAFLKRNKTLVIFLKHCLKYFSLLAVLVLMISPLFFKSYTMAKESTIERSNLKLKEGLAALEGQIIKAQEIAGILRQEDHFKRLFFLEGKPPSEYYVDMDTLQTKLKNLSLTQDMMSNVYIMFKDNPIFISNHISADNYMDVYKQYFHYADMPVDEFHDILFNQNENVRLLPAMQTLSLYYSRSYFQGVTAIISNSYFNGTDQKSIMAIVFDKKDIIGNVLYEEDSGDHFAYMTDSGNNLLLTHNYDGPVFSNPVHNLDEITLASQKYIMLAHTSEKLGLKTVIGIPLNTFQQNVNAILELVTLYIVIGTLVILVLSVLFSMKETLWLKRMLEAASKSTNTIFTAKNEYMYINNAFAKISTMNKEQLDKIEALNSSVKHSVLKHLLILGVYTEKEKEEADSYFGSRFDRFCVAKAGFRLDESDQATRSIQQGLILAVENTFKSIVQHEYTAINFHSNEVIFVVFLGAEAEIDSIRERLSELIRTMNTGYSLTINIGLSQIMSGNRNAKAAYQQAKHALSINENDISSGVYIFEAALEQADKQMFDMTLLFKLNDALIAGEKPIVAKLFAESLHHMAKYPDTGQEQLQMFFLYRQAVYNARNIIVNDQSQEAARSQLSIPRYDHVTDVIKLFYELRDAALNLCDWVNMNKKSNNEKLKADIIHYIHEHYEDPALSASTIATALLISEKYVFSFVKEQAGKSLGKYIEEIRINNAERLLLETDYSNSKILQLCGFGSENTFYRAFSKRHAVSPTAWREINKQ